MATEEYSEKDIRDLITSFREGLQLYKSNLTPSKLSQIYTTKDVDASIELSNMTKLIFAHSTKIGIAFRPPVSINAAYKQLQEVSEVFSVILGIASGFIVEKYSALFRDEILENINALVSRFITLLDELALLDYDSLKLKSNVRDTKDGTDGRLVSIGKIWDTCHKIEKILKDGKLGLLKYRIRLSISLIEDGLLEFDEWLENPEVLDDFDPFGLNNYDDNDKEEEEADETEEDKEVDPEVLNMGKQWNDKIKLLKLLLSSLIKSLPTEESTVSGVDVDNFNKEQEKLIEFVDDLIANFFLNSRTEKLQEIIKKIQKKSDLLIELVKSLNKNDDKKTKWLIIWQERFKK